MIYLKNGRECLLCATRKKLIIATPEERVRQQFIRELSDSYEVPLDHIWTEVPLSWFSKGERGRADLIVFESGQPEHPGSPLIIVECKGPEVPLTDFVLKQACAYNKTLQAKLVVLTNGREKSVRMLDERKGGYYELVDIPRFKCLLRNKGFRIRKDKGSATLPRPNHLSTDKRTFGRLIDIGVIGEDTEKKNYSFFANLHGLVIDVSTRAAALELQHYRLISDGGLRFTTFGNASGGGFPGNYRYLIIGDKKGESQIISFSIMGRLSAKNHPKYGNSTGYTMLLVAIDDFERSHLSLELALDRFIQVNKNSVSVIHDGTLTVGKKGRVKNKEVIDFIRAANPKLIKDEKVFLGTLDNSAAFTWEREDVQYFISNVIEYALLRDVFRKTR